MPEVKAKRRRGPSQAAAAVAAVADEFPVERIVDCRTRPGVGVEYRVRWEGYSAADDTWEPAASLTTSASERVAEFEAAAAATKRVGVEGLTVQSVVDLTV